MDFTFRSIQRPLIRPCGAPSPHWGEGYVIWANANQHTFLEKGDDLKTRFASLLEKERFLESKEKGAPVGVEWSQIGIRRPVFTPPLRSSPVHGRLPGWNRGKLWSYPTFFRRLRGWELKRGGASVAAWVRFAAWGAAPSLFPIHTSLFLLFVGRDDLGAPNHAAGWA